MPTTIQLPSDTSPPTAPNRRRRRIALIAAGTGGVLALAAGSLTVANQAMAKHDQHSFSADGIRELVIDQDAGDVTLVAGSANGRVQVDTTRSWAWTRPDADHTVHDGVLTLTGDCPGFGLGSCDVHQRVTVPAGLRVRIAISSGSVQAADLDLARFDVTTDSGSIRAAGLKVPSFHGKTSAGSVTASFTTTPEHVTARSSSGNVTITVPQGTYNVDAGTSSGQVRVDVADDPDNARLILAHTSSGDITVARR